MNTPSRPMSTGLVPEACIAAGAVLADRGGHTLVAHYGSVPAEIAVCQRSVGLIDRSEFGALELRAETSLLDRALADRLGDPPIAPGSARRLRDVWYLRLDRRRTLLVGPHLALASGPAIGRGHDRAELACHDIRATISILSVIGPRAGRLMAAAGLPNDLPSGALGQDPSDRGVVAILRESQRRLLILVRAQAADELWSRLLTAGEPLDAACVGCDALGLLGAASRSS